MNVARAVRLLGSYPVCTGLLAGHIMSARSQLTWHEPKALGCRWSWIEGETRTNAIIVRAADGKVTVINAPGPNVSVTGWQRFGADVEAEAAAGVCLCGSLPPGIGRNDVMELGRPSAGERPAGVGGQQRGGACRRRQGPSARGQDYNAERRPVTRRTTFAAGGCVDTVVITLGLAGAVAVTAEAVWRTEVSPVDSENPTGSRDSFLFALTISLLRSQPMAEALRRATAAGSAAALQRARTAFAMMDFLRLLSTIQVMRDETEEHPRQQGKAAWR
ncbi:MAG: tagatose 6-phosphate kinase [Rhodospirillaceae bacterium]|nr:MAG: tagatose 6-phosphate kinase [Rhodospirillaceae bacterium]